MRILIMLAALLCLALVLGGCDDKEISKAMESWKGHHYSELIRGGWGMPSQIIQDGRGGLIIAYYYDRTLGRIQPRSNTYITGYITDDYVNAQATTYYTPGQTLSYTAERYFYTTPDGIIYDWWWKGL